MRFVTTAPSLDSVNADPNAAPVYTTKPGSIIVPGLSGTAETIAVFIGVSYVLVRCACSHPLVWMEEATCVGRFKLNRRSALFLERCGDTCTTK